MNELRRWLIAPAIAALCGGCTSYVVLEAGAGSSSSTAYVCPAFTQGDRGVLTGECRADTTVDEARWNQSGTTRHPLPDCPHGIHRIRVGGGDVLVECAAPSAPVDVVVVPPDEADPPPPDTL